MLNICEDNYNNVKFRPTSDLISNIYIYSDSGKCREQFALSTMSINNELLLLCYRYMVFLCLVNMKRKSCNDILV